MEHDHIRELIGRLIASTRSRKLSWEETADENTFRLILDVGIIHIQQNRQQTPPGTPAPGTYTLLFLNENNTPVVVWEASVPEDERQLRDLFEAARDSGLKPKEFFHRLEQEVIRRSG
jgi:hypothetical protein